MVPEYFPRLEYLAQMQASEQVLVAASRQYVRQSWQNRTRIRTPYGSQWITIPIRGGQHGRSCAATITASGLDWRRHHWKAIVNSYGHTPFFDRYSELIQSLLREPREMLGDITCASVRLLHDLFGLECTLLFEEAASASVRFRGRYRSLTTLGDKPSQDPQLLFQFTEHPYRQAFAGFEPGMTALDLLFGYGPGAASRLRSMATIKQFQESRD